MQLAGAGQVHFMPTSSPSTLAVLRKEIGQARGDSRAQPRKLMHDMHDNSRDHHLKQSCCRSCSSSSSRPAAVYFREGKEREEKILADDEMRPYSNTVALLVPL